MSKILITARSFLKSANAQNLLKNKHYELIFNPYDRPLKEDEMLNYVNGIDAIIAGLDEITEKVIANAMPTLKIIARHGVGYNNVDLNAAKKFGVFVTITPKANSVAVAELTIGLMIALARKITVIDEKIRNESLQRIMGTELNDKTLGIIGLGNIGSEVVKRLYYFNMKILAYDKYKTSEMIEKYNVSYVSLDELLTQSDFITLHMNVTDETMGLINKNNLEKMKKNVILINTARSELIIEKDLYDVLKNKKIAGAGIDVFENEPLKESPFFELENVILTSHIGAYTFESVDKMAIMAAQEVIRVLNGKEPKNRVC